MGEFRQFWDAVRESEWVRERERTEKATRTPIPAIAVINTPNTNSCCHPPRSPESTGSRPHPGFGNALMHSVMLRSRSRYTFSSGTSGGTVATAGAPSPTVSAIAATNAPTVLDQPVTPPS